MATGVPLITLTAREVKEQAVGDPNASKEQMVEWATQFDTSYEDMWPTHRGKIVMGKAEHMADALGAINAAINLEKLPRGF
jgi:Holliday junction resolvasome RuvABC endonuclease subunit